LSSPRRRHLGRRPCLAIVVLPVILAWPLSSRLSSLPGRHLLGRRPRPAVMILPGRRDLHVPVVISDKGIQDGGVVVLVNFALYM